LIFSSFSSIHALLLVCFMCVRVFVYMGRASCLSKVNDDDDDVSPFMASNPQKP